MNMPMPSNDPQVLHRAIELANNHICSLRDYLQHAQDQLRIEQADNDRLVELVKRLEYCDQDENTGLGYCPICGKGIHPDSCELKTIVAEMERKKAARE